jgi:dTDP-glucose pyrophosphorylase
MIDKEQHWRRSIISPHDTLGDVIENLNRSGLRVVLCVDENGLLIGIATDGDLRRGVLRGLGMEAKVEEILNRDPLVVPYGSDRRTAQALMISKKVLQIPVVDVSGCVVGLYLWEASEVVQNHNHSMIIMAGGKGVRLRPFTDNCPKPMLNVGGKPMLQHIIERAKSQGFKRFIISLNYLGQIIKEHFKDGSKFEVEILYAQEDNPLGTAGALSLIHPRLESDFVVTNGDVLADIDYFDLINFRERHNALGAMAVRLFEWNNPYGVVQMQGADITGFTEKPVVRSHINAGIYAFSPSVFDHLVREEHCDMPTLFDRLREAGHRTVAYPMHEPWLDIGRPDDLERANVEFAEDFE